jgi:hypothetical protein
LLAGTKDRETTESLRDDAFRNDESKYRDLPLRIKIS